MSSTKIVDLHFYVQLLRVFKTIMIKTCLLPHTKRERTEGKLTWTQYVIFSGFHKTFNLSRGKTICTQHTTSELLC